MIEKFTKEELAIIMRELKELPRAHQKRDICEESLNKLNKEYKSRPRYQPFYWDLVDGIFSVADHIMCNYVPNTKKKNYWRRASYVPNEYCEEYKNLVEELVTIAIKHYKEKVPNSDEVRDI